MYERNKGYFRWERSVIMEFKRSSNVQYEQLGKLDGRETQVIFKIYQVKIIILKHASVFSS